MTTASEEYGLTQLPSECLILIGHSEAQAARLTAAANALLPDRQPVLLPGWDCLPFDRTSPSRAVMGQRMRALRLMMAGETRLVVASPEAAVQLLPASPGDAIAVSVGDVIDPDRFCAALIRVGYVEEDEAHQPGEVVRQGAVIDVVPAEGGPALRLRLEGMAPACRVVEIDVLDPASQRTAGSLERASIGPASEIIADPDAGPAGPGAEHRLAELAGPLVSPFAIWPDALVILDPGAEDRVAEQLAQIDEARAARIAMCRATGDTLPADGLYLTKAAWRAVAKHAKTFAWPELEPVPAFRTATDALRAARAFVHARLSAGERVALSGKRLARALRLETQAFDDWRAFTAAETPALGLLPDGMAHGFIAPEGAAIAEADVLPPRRTAGGTDGLFDMAWHPGDAVIHLDYGMATLDGIEMVTATHASDHLVLGFAGGARKLVDCAELDRVWRYGAGKDGVSLDRANGASWQKRRDRVLAELADTAGTLVERAAAKAALAATPCDPPGRQMDRFIAGFGFTPTPDQAGAFEDIAADLARPVPMDRLLCGDVGFGKTEAALRAAAAAALSGHQVAILAPTTVLVRQHLASFQRRFAPFKIEVAALSRLNSAAEARAVKARLADGSLRVVVGTQALASGVTFADLALVIVDEEQRFGTKAKAALAGLKDGVHSLALSATPIPRTLQGALAGLQAISVLSTPPARRQPVRTTVSPLDEAVVKTALLREHARGGQSFCVCPRIADLDALAATLKRLVPTLSVVQLHGKMKPDALDAALVGFADGRGDVLLSTDIIEAGLDIPRANTILVWNADQFGLAQLHQLRGRVGRGRARGMAWLFTDPAAASTEAAQHRLAALTAHDGLGAGFAIAACDLDQRGAGDLVGEDQAGHVKLLGVELARHLLSQAMARVRGEAVDECRPVLELDLPAHVPADYMPDPAARIALHARLCRETDIAAIAEELEDRFGPPPEPCSNLLVLAELRGLCRRLGVSRLAVGPTGAAADIHGEQERHVLKVRTSNASERLQAAKDILESLG